MKILANRNLILNGKPIKKGETILNIKIKKIRFQYYSHLEIWRLKITIGINGLNPCRYWLERFKFDIDYDQKDRKPEDIPAPIFGFIFYRKVNYLDIINSKLHFGINLWKWVYYSEKFNTKIK